MGGLGRSHPSSIRIVDFAIRGAKLSDAAEIAVLMCELGYQTSRAEMKARLQRILPNSRYKTLVALANGRICGIIGTVSYPSYEHNDPSGRIIALVVSEKLRRCGMGRKLLAAAETAFAQRGITRIAVNTRLTRKQAHQFYKALGYQRNGWRFVKNLPG